VTPSRRGALGLAVAGLAAIFVAQDIPTRHAIEHDLTTRSATALREAGLSTVDVSFTGRDGTLDVPPGVDANRALAVVRSQDGVRVVRARSRPVPPRPEASPTPTASNSPTPAQSQPAPVQSQLAALPQITFETGSATLTPQGRAAVDQAAGILRASPTIRVRIEGHTDSTGTPEANLALSRARAQTVLDTLLSLGIAADRMSAVGYGDTRPEVPDTTPANQAVNRRVEFVVLP
jgi:outer membrane protein OmpA-like peptidoglycan-associated protein